MIVGKPNSFKEEFWSKWGMRQDDDPALWVLPKVIDLMEQELEEKGALWSEMI